MSVKRVEQLGEFKTLRAMARSKGTSVNALYLWMRDHDITITKLGNMVVVRDPELAGYQARGQKKALV